MKIKKPQFLLGLFFSLLISLPLSAQSLDGYLVKTLDLLASRALDAYNSNDYVAFYQYFSKKTENFAKQRHFEAEFVSIHKQNLGNAIRRTLVLPESSLDYHFPELVYRAEFQKYKNAVITIDFINENDNYRISRIRFDRVYDDNKHL